MKCHNCEQTAVIELQHGGLCKNHFINYFENKIFKTINKHKLISRDDKLCVAASGGKDSLTLLYVLKKYFKRYKFNNDNMWALVVDEGIAGYRNVTLEYLEEFCKKHEITLKKCSFKEEFGSTLDKALPIVTKKTGKKACNLCGAWRRYLLNKYAKITGATKIATGHNLDDEAQAIMMNMCKANTKQAAKMGPMTGLKDHDGFVRRIKPLYFCSEKETRLYTFLLNIKVDNAECPNVYQSYRAEIRDMLNNFEAKFPGTKTGIINSFLYTLPMLKEHELKQVDSNKIHALEPQKCTKCGEPSHKNLCNACEFVELVKDE